MKNKIVVLFAVASLFMASCSGKKAESQDEVKADSTVVKADSTVTTAPQDSVKAN